MPLRYPAADALPIGLPLGGMGCGTLQVFPDGSRGLFTGMNNWEQPLKQIHGFRPGPASDFRYANPFGLFVAWNDRRVAKLLQRAPIAKCPTVQQITMDADFPVADVAFHDPDIPVQVSVSHWSPFIPHDSKHSALPVVVSVFRITNPLDVPATVSVLACCLNVVGAWNVGRHNRIVREDGRLALECRRRHSHARDERAGELALMADVELPNPRARRSNGEAALELSYLASWMYAKEAFRANFDDRRLEAWQDFVRDGRLPNKAAGPEAVGELDEPMGALAVRTTLAPGQSTEIAFAYSWFMPNHLYGHRYERWFAGAGEVARYALKKRTELSARSGAWHRIVRQSGLPEWLADGLINCLSIYSAASWWTKDGRFAICENPMRWPLADSLDVRYYGTFPLAFWFPELEQSTMRQFARAQRPDGRIPHDLGKAQLDCPSDGTTAGLPWKDLSPKFALMVYRDACLGEGDMPFLREMYPHVKRAMEWELGTDRNGDGLPDNEGLDSTYDLWPFYGTNSYTSSIFLASLRATERMAQLMKDETFARRCRRVFQQGAASFDDKLWAGSYYLAARHNDGSTYDACITGQLNGQWYAHLLGLGHLLPPDRVKKAVQTVLRLNGQASRFGAVNAVFPDGRIDTSSWHSGNIWIGETYALASLAMYEGLIDEGLELTRRMWTMFVEQAKSPWSQPDVIAASDGHFGEGEFYIRNVAIWTLPWALARWDARVRHMMHALGLPVVSSSGRTAATVRA